MEGGVDVFSHLLQYHVVVEADDRVPHTWVRFFALVIVQGRRGVRLGGSNERELIAKERRHEHSVRGPGLPAEEQVRPSLGVGARHDLWRRGDDDITDELL